MTRPPPRPRRGAAPLAAMALLWLLGAAGAAAERGSAPLEARVKAAYLYNFLLFVDWPDRVQGPWRVCVAGRGSFNGALEPITGRTARDQPITLSRPQAPREAAGCHLLFVSAAEAPRWPEWAAGIAGRPVLSVSDMEGFAGRGGMIGLVLRDGRVRMDIDLDRARAAGLAINSKLLEVADRVLEGGNGP